ncbi:hypothetical protein ETB97_001978 [Aspergillus alliaceus]|uniref:Thioesterase domain-containing protein n=1 Tax=Petromyces alliaceus TaxID=209559 RepID=A0A8H6AG47_PETAA|nr:hypothetical protein ETB97_001978 [Aspergillus burnettii]
MSSPQPFTRVLSPPLNFLPPNTPPHLFSATVEHFTSIPWCAKLLSADPAAPNNHSQPIPFISQSFNPESPEHDQFVGTTLTSPQALRRGLGVFRPEDPEHTRDPTRPITKVISLYTVGNGLCGFKGILHGGMIMTLFDEVTGSVVEINMALGKKWIQSGLMMVTGSLSVKFLRPVPVNSEVCATAWLEKIEGRKAMIRAEITGSEGERMATAESVWVVIAPKV